MSTKLSWRALIDAKIIKRTDNGMCVRPDAIRVVPGFNLRDTTSQRYKDGLAALKAHMARGGHVPPLEVALSADGMGVDIVEGHRRTAVYLELIADGQPIEWIRIEPFIGNDIERKTRVLTSQDNEKLLPLEIAEGYRQLAAFGLTPDDIARRVCKTRQHVDQLLILAGADHSVQKMVADGEVSATTAVDVARKHGRNAAGVLKEAKAKAGQGKVTAAAVKPWTPPAKVVAPVVTAVSSLLESLDNEDRARVESDAPDVFVSVSARELLDLFKAYNGIEAAAAAAVEKQRAKQAKAAQGELVGSDGA